MVKYFVGVFAFFIVVALVVVAAVIIGRGPAEPDPADDVREPANLTNFIDRPGAAVVFTRQGAIVGEEEHNVVRITVDRNQRKIEHLRGYNGRVQNSLIYSNTQPAFDYFMHALQIAGFTARQEAGHESHKGVCPFGRRYFYELLEAGRPVSRLWSTSCRAADGDFAGETRQINRLFADQIPRYREFTRGLAL